MPLLARTVRFVALLGLTALAACPRPANGPEDPTAEGAVVPAGAVDPDAAASADAGQDAADPVAAGGCLSDADCNGGVCEGEGCGDDQPGVCASPDRMCTRDSRPYCGCDGQTFRSSGSCPGQRYASKGMCEGAADPSAPPPKGAESGT
ncbi:MAG: hypothetical protein AB1Z98_31260 [Nannocystaceae bacterium]